MIEEKVDAGNKNYEALLYKDLEILRNETKELGSRLVAKIAESGRGNLRWVFGFFIALAMMIIGLYLKK